MLLCFRSSSDLIRINVVRNENIFKALNVARWISFGNRNFLILGTQWSNSVKIVSFYRKFIWSALRDP